MVYKYKYMLIIASNTSSYTNILRTTALHFTYPLFFSLRVVFVIKNIFLSDWSI
jgi:hypothetical protein